MMAGHTCHWPGCPTQVPKRLWGCSYHWFKLPLRLRNKIWAHYVPGQEIRGDPSADYIATALEVQDWIQDWIVGDE